MVSRSRRGFTGEPETGLGAEFRDLFAQLLLEFEDGWDVLTRGWQRFHRIQRSLKGGTRFLGSPCLLKNVAFASQPCFFARRFRGYGVEPGQSAVVILLFKLKIDRAELECDQRSQFLNSLIQTLQCFLCIRPA